MPLCILDFTLGQAAKIFLMKNVGNQTTVTTSGNIHAGLKQLSHCHSYKVICVLRSFTRICTSKDINSSPKLNYSLPNRTAQHICTLYTIVSVRVMVTVNV